MKFTRRGFSKLGLMAGIGLGIPLGRVAGPVGRLVESASVTSPRVEKFEVPLSVPPVLGPVRTEGTTDYYEITQREETVEILPGYETRVWGYNGIFPGPTIEARRGREVVIEQQNELPIPVSTHLHGGVTPPESDGFPTDLILPPDLSMDDLPGHVSGTVAGISYGSKEFSGEIERSRSVDESRENAGVSGGDIPVERNTIEFR